MKLLLPYLFIFLSLSVTAQDVIETEKATMTFGEGYTTKKHATFKVLGKDNEGNIYLLKVISSRKNTTELYSFETYNSNLIQVKTEEIKPDDWEQFLAKMSKERPALYYSLDLHLLNIDDVEFRSYTDKIKFNHPSLNKKQIVSNQLIESEVKRKKEGTYESNIISYDLNGKLISSVESPIKEHYKFFEHKKPEDITPKQMDSLYYSDVFGEFIGDYTITTSPENDLILIFNQIGYSYLHINPTEESSKRIDINWNNKPVHLIRHYFKKNGNMVLYGFIINKKAPSTLHSGLIRITEHGPDTYDLGVPTEIFWKEIDYKSGKIVRDNYLQVNDKKLIVTNADLDQFPMYHMTPEDMEDKEITRKEGHIPLRIVDMYLSEDNSIFVLLEWRNTFDKYSNGTTVLHKSVNSNVLYKISKEGEIEWAKRINRTHEVVPENYYPELHTSGFTTDNKFYILQKESKANFNHWETKEAKQSSLSGFIISLIEIDENGTETRTQLLETSEMMKYGGVYHANSAWVDDNDIYVVLSSGNVSDYRLAKFTIK